MVRAQDVEIVFEGRLNPCVVDVPAPSPVRACQHGLRTQATGVVDVLEESVRASLARLPDDVVLVTGSKQAQRPIQSARQYAAQADLDVPCDDFVQRRIGQKGIRQTTLLDLSRDGVAAQFLAAGQFDGRGQTAGLVICRVDVQKVRPATHCTHTPVEIPEVVLAVQLRLLAGSITQFDSTVVIEGGQHDRPVLAEREPVARVDVIPRHIGFDFGSLVGKPAAHRPRGRRRARPGIEQRELDAGIEVAAATIESGAHRQVMRKPEDLRGGVDFQDASPGILPPVAQVVDRTATALADSFRVFLLLEVPTTACLAQLVLHGIAAGAPERAGESCDSAEASVDEFIRLILFQAIAIERSGVVAAVVKVGRDVDVFGERMVAPQRQRPRIVASDVGSRENLCATHLEQSGRRQSVARQVRPGPMVVEAQGAPVPPPIQARIKIFGPRRRQVPPPALLESLRVEVVGPRAVVAAALDVGDRPAVGAAFDFDSVLRMAEPVLHLHDHRAAQGIQSIQGVRAAEQAEACDRIHGHEVPVHGVAQGFVEPHTVLVDRQTHGQAQQRRGGIAPIVEVRLQRIALGGVDMHTAEAPAEVTGNVGAAAGRKLICRGGLDNAGKLARTRTLGAHGRSAEHHYGFDVLCHGRRHQQVQCRHRNHCRRGRQECSVTVRHMRSIDGIPLGEAKSSAFDRRDHAVYGAPC